MPWTLERKGLSVSLAIPLTPNRAQNLFLCLWKDVMAAFKGLDGDLMGSCSLSRRGAWMLSSISPVWLVIRSERRCLCP